MAPQSPTPATAAPDDQFEALYLALRRRLLLQCFALTGDLPAARSGVRDAFVVARQQWRRVGAMERPEPWIRQRAMSATQRRHVPHRRRAPGGVTGQQTLILRALQSLKEGERKALILRHLGDLDTLAIGRELALTEASATERVRRAEANFIRLYGCEQSRIGDELRSLAPVVTHPGLPRVHAMYHLARRRSQLQVAIGVVVAAALATIGGLIVHPTAHSDALALIQREKVEEAHLLTAGAVGYALPSRPWSVTSTSANTDGDTDGIHDLCQRERFADPGAAITFVRVFRGGPKTTATQHVEVSVGTDRAEQTFATTLNWYTDCSQTRARVISAGRVTGIGDQAWILTMQVLGPPAQDYQVLISRTGMVVDSTVIATPPGQLGQIAPIAGIAVLGRTASLRLCEASAALTCHLSAKPVVTTVVPPTTQPVSFLTTTDLPLLSKVERPWVGTDPVSGGDNLAKTLCDDTTFKGAKTQGRSFLIPGAGLPQTFGITETIATYPTANAAAKATTKIQDLMRSCHERQIGTIVDQSQQVPPTAMGPSAVMWHEQAQRNAQSAIVTYWMGVTQFGTKVAQVTFIPSPSADIKANAFMAVMQRAAERLAQK